MSPSTTQLAAIINKTSKIENHQVDIDESSLSYHQDGLEHSGENS
jgi:hypothetical protein